MVKSIEALLALVAVLSFSLLVLAEQPPELNDSLYRYQLGNDVWRVLYLRGDLEGFDKDAMNRDVVMITELTGIYIDLKEEDVASIPGEEKLVVLSKKAWVRGEVQNLTLTLASK